METPDPGVYELPGASTFDPFLRPGILAGSFLSLGD